MASEPHTAELTRHSLGQRKLATETPRHREQLSLFALCLRGSVAMALSLWFEHLRLKLDRIVNFVRTKRN